MAVAQLAALAHLAAYVSAIHQQSSPAVILGQDSISETWQDQGCTVSKSTTTYRFANGVVIRRTLEQDDFPSEQACAECWITYEVLAAGDLAERPTPVRQVFANACRETFWLAYHRV